MKIIFKLLFILLFVTVLALVIVYARGYRLDYKKKSLTSTGILAFTSYPKTAKIYVDSKLRGVTDSSLIMPPGNYQVDIKKDGYTSLSKKVTLKGELVVTIDALLFPLNPSLSPLTNLGIIKSVAVNDTEKVLIFVDKEISLDEVDKNGIYLFESGRRPLPFFPPLKPVIMKKNLPVGVDFETAEVTVSPDSKEAIFEFGENKELAYLLSLESENLTPFDVAFSKNNLFKAWNEQRQDNYLKILETYPEEFAKIASASVEIISFAPSETKLLYKANENLILPPIITPPLVVTNQTPETRNLEKGKIYVYDRKEDKNYLIANCQLPIANCAIQWYFDSRHLVVNEGKKIMVTDYDGESRQTLYSGPYESSFFMSTLDGRLVVLSNLNPEVNLWPDLYLVGTR